MAEKKSYEREMILTPTNYNIWKPVIRTTLKAKENAFRFCESFHNPQDLTSEERTLFYFAVKLILRSVDSSLNSIIRPPLFNTDDDDNPHRLWTAIEAYFLPQSTDARHAGKLLFFHIIMLPEEDTTSFINRVTAAARQVNELVDKAFPNWRVRIRGWSSQIENPPPFPFYPPGYINEDDMISVILCSIRHFYNTEYPTIRQAKLSFNDLCDHIRNTCINKTTSTHITIDAMQASFLSKAQIDFSINSSIDPSDEQLRLLHTKKRHSNTSSSFIQPPKKLRQDPPTAPSLNGQEFYCLLHEENDSHNTDQCRILRSCKSTSDIDKAKRNWLWKRKEKLNAIAFEQPFPNSSDSD
jgi:hypothetical protein